MRLGRRSTLTRHDLASLAGPVRAQVARFALAALLALSVLLLALGKAEVRLIDHLRVRIGDAAAPVLGALVEPIAAARRLARGLGEVVAVHEDNARLREQNRRLLEWQMVAQRLLLENAALREALNAAAEPEEARAVTARVVTDRTGPFVRTVLINAGADHGVTENMAAVGDGGLVGRVIEVGRRSARVLLLTDFNSRLPVLVQPSRDRAILTGNNSQRPELIFLPLSPRVAVGDPVVTSGDDGLLPPGLPVGRVSAIDADRVTVTPFVDWDRLDYLSLLAYPAVPPPEPVAHGGFDAAAVVSAVPGARAGPDRAGASR